MGGGGVDGQLHKHRSLKTNFTGFGGKLFTTMKDSGHAGSGFEAKIGTTFRLLRSYQNELLLLLLCVFGIRHFEIWTSQHRDCYCSP